MTKDYEEYLINLRDKINSYDTPEADFDALIRLNDAGAYIRNLENNYKMIINELSNKIAKLVEEKDSLNAKLDNNTKIYLNTSKYASETEGKYITTNYIITELEKWLYEMNRKHMDDSNFYNSFCFLTTLNKIAELKGSDKE